MTIKHLIPGSLFRLDYTVQVCCIPLKVLDDEGFFYYDSAEIAAGTTVMYLRIPDKIDLPQGWNRVEFAIILNEERTFLCNVKALDFLKAQYEQ